MTEIKRTNYATGQFLTAGDFDREQAYHQTLRRTGNASLYTWGVVNGLDVTMTDTTHLQVAPGMAIDHMGRDIVLLEPATIALAPPPGSRQLYLTIAYGEVQDGADKVQIGGVHAYIATTERPTLGFADPGADGNGVANPPPADTIVLALVVVDEAGAIGTLSTTKQPLAGSALPPATRFSQLTVADRLDCGMLALHPVPALVNSQPLNQAAIQNSDAGNSLDIIGRTIDDGSAYQGSIRTVRIFDTVEVVGSLRITANGGCRNSDGQYGNLNVAGSVIAGGLCFFSAGINAGSGTFHSTTIVTDGYYGGNLKVNGRLLATAKTGYVMDRFVNRLGESLEVGDVVVLGASAPTLAYGIDDSIPVPEVDLTDTTGDTRVCGIVCEVHGESEGGGADEGGMHVFSEEERAGMDLGTVAPGQLGHMVTLGAYAACKVDADIAPIAAGDLLTTSPTRGHAQKVLDRGQAVGAIVGKAMAPLASGRGKIPVLVTLH